MGIDNLPGAVTIYDADIPRRCVLLFGGEGPGLSAGARRLAERVLAIPQYGSTRSINAGSASAVAMAEWCRRWAGAPSRRRPSAARSPPGVVADYPRPISRSQSASEVIRR